MDTVIFNGRSFAVEKEEELKKQAIKLRKKGIVSKLVSILVGNDPASHLYVNLKRLAAERIGAEVDIKRFKETADVNDITEFIKIQNNTASIHGIMIQLPLPARFSKEDRDEIINSISKEKDVDGLCEESLYLTPTVKSVLFALRDASKYIVRPNMKVIVVGYSGFEGGKIYTVLKEMGYDIEGADSKTKNLKLKTRNTDILISATGHPGLIRGDMIKKGCIIIDVGSPKGDVAKDEVMGKAIFISPVPGGIGPVTIVSLLENLINSSSKLNK